MTQAISGYFIRLFIGGFAVFCVMAVVGKGGVSEAVRLCCACFMIILILTPGISAGDILSQLSTESENARLQLEDRVSEGTRAAYDEINRAVEEYVSGLIFTGEKVGEVKIKYETDDNGGYVPVSAKVSGQNLDRENVKKTLTDATGISEENIIFEG